MKIPLFPLDVVLFPGAPLPLHIFESRYREMIGECLDGSRVFGVVRAQRDGLPVVGCTARIVRVLRRYPDGRLDILCQGETRFEIKALDNSRAFLQAEVDFLCDADTPASRELRGECIALHCETLELAGLEPGGAALKPERPVSFQLASAIPADLGFKQDILCTRSDEERTLRLIAFYHAVLPKLRRGVQASLAAHRNGHVM